MRYLFGFMCVLAVGVMPLVGCSETAGDGGAGGSAGSGGMGGDGGSAGSGGTAGDGGSGGAVSCMDSVCPCTEAGIRAAIAQGGGPFTFACDGPQNVVLEEAVVVDKSVILDGLGNLSLTSERQSGFAEPLFIVQTSFELRGFRLSNPLSECIYGGGELKFVDSAFEECRTGIRSGGGALQVEDCTFSGGEVAIDFGFGGGEAGTIVNTTVYGVGISVFTGSSVTLVSSTLSGGGIGSAGFGGDGTAVTLVNSTISGSDGEAILNIDDITLISSTIANNNDTFPALSDYKTLNVSNSIVDGECDGSSGSITSNGYNIESPGDTCGFDQTGDQASVTAEQLNLGELANNGGPTMTHKPGEGGFGDGSVAINQIAEADCGAATDQRGRPRPEVGGTMCDVGAVEVQVPFSCTEQGIRDAIAEGGGPHTFDCDPPNGVYEVFTKDTIEINNDVKLDGGGGMVVNGGGDHRVFSISAGTTVELRGVRVENGAVGWPDSGGGIFNAGELTLVNCGFSRNAAVDEVQNCPNFEGCPSYGAGIFNDAGGELTLTNTSVDNNLYGEGIFSMGVAVVTNSIIRDNGKEGTRKASGISIGSAAGPNPIDGTLTLTNSTVSFSGFSGIENFGGPVSVVNSTIDNNEEWGIDSPHGLISVVNSTVAVNRFGIRSASTLTATHTTVTGNRELAILLSTADAAAILSAMLVDGTCMQEHAEATWTSNGYNIESPDDTCGLDTDKGDQISVSTEDLGLYVSLEDNGGPTFTYALLPGSVAIGVIPEAECEVDTDQRGKPRPETGGTMCDVGSFERQP